MNIASIRAFFKWCTILNGGLLVLSSLVLMYAGDFVFRVHSQWFPMSREAFSAAIYEILGLFKIVVLTFNLVPYVCLRIIERKQSIQSPGTRL
jgi:hypothetical protein